MLEQMSEASSSNAFIGRADMVPEVHRNDRRGAILGKCDEEPVFQAKCLDRYTHYRKLTEMDRQSNPVPDAPSTPGPAVLTTIASALGAALLLLGILVGLVWIFQERIAFQPPTPPRTMPAASDDVRLDSYLAADGQRLISFVVGSSPTAKGLLLCFHGNADLAGNAIEWARRVSHATSFTVMLAEYRGYMNLGGRPTYLTSQIDSEAAFTHARDSLHFAPERIALYGHSLGTAVATELATRHTPLSLVLESPFTSAHDMARIVAWRGIEIFWDLITRFHFDTLTAVSSIDAPVWVAHGTRDRVIPPAMGKQVFAAAKVKGQLLIVPDAAHNDVADVGGVEYWRWIEASLSK